MHRGGIATSRYDAAMPEFDAPHTQPPHAPPSEARTARRVPIAMILTLVVTAAAVAAGVYLIWVSMTA